MQNLILASAGIVGVSCSRKGAEYTNQGVGAVKRLYRKFQHWCDLYQEYLDRPGRGNASYPIPSENEYREFLTKLKLRHFHPNEIIGPHRNVKNGVSNHIPPKHLWTNIEGTLKTVDELRERLGARGTVLSIYRSQKYNTAIGGASKSQHMRNRAIDVKFACSSDRAFQEALKMRKEGFFQGGIGWYPTFIHLDTRGYDCVWGKEEPMG